MRDFTKSIFSFSWAMSLFGIQQTTNLMSGDKAAKAFDLVTDKTQEQFSDVLKTTFNAGDKLQRSAVDMTLGMVTGEALNPNRWIRMASDAAKQSADALTKGMQEVSSTMSQAASTGGQGCCGETGSGSASGGPSPRQGWGPIPS